MLHMGLGSQNSKVWGAGCGSSRPKTCVAQPFPSAAHDKDDERQTSPFGGSDKVARNESYRIQGVGGAERWIPLILINRHARNVCITLKSVLGKFNEGAGLATEVGRPVTQS